MSYDCSEHIDQLHGKAKIIFNALFWPIFFVVLWCICGCPNCCWLSRRRRNHVTYYTTAASTVSPTTTSTTFEQSVSTDQKLNSTPSFVYFRRTEGEDVLDCAVCLGTFKHGEKGRLLIVCGHSFHAECIDEWFKLQSTCPICRRSAVLINSSNTTTTVEQLPV